MFSMLLYIMLHFKFIQDILKIICIALLIALLFVSIPGGEEFKKLAKINII